ncbi:hypothetical protein [Neobacillus mesonae]|uniref:hypothetical protein n=1 Tax=Neobacillus mesonae TaxID=1193713 RepID=UPI00203AA6CB|nr:hypothetical protein [Neobacillus mesonae]MCM3567018.1 hypothetical protein [Neobacillus mesonae]
MFYKNKLEILTLKNIELEMNKGNFHQEFIKDITDKLNNRIKEYGEQDFQKWLSNLHYQLPEEFQNEDITLRTYTKCQHWIEKEVKRLEMETKLSWEIQSEDLIGADERVRKTQLVIRHRLSEVVLGLLV